jgi:hypothetical protein
MKMSMKNNVYLYLILFKMKMKVKMIEKIFFLNEFFRCSAIEILKIDLLSI